MSKTYPEARHAVETFISTRGVEPTPAVHYGTERDYLLWRLNQRNQHGINPGMADYVGVRKTGKWEAA